MINSINISIIIPCFNEEKRLQVVKFQEFLNQNKTCRLLFVNDGSMDNTLDIISGIASSNNNSNVLNLKTNVGKAEAVRQGVQYLKNNFEQEYIGYFDADLSTPLEEIEHFHELISNEGKNLLMVVGSRIKRLGSNVKRNESRHYLGRVFATVASLILTIPVYDTQCGAKLFKSEIADKVFMHSFISKWFFDVEIFARLIINYNKKYIIKHVYEYPLNTWIDEGNSRIKIMDFLKVPFDLFRIYRHYHKGIKRAK